jgi:hypothetical protein
LWILSVVGIGKINPNLLKQLVFWFHIVCFTATTAFSINTPYLTSHDKASHIVILSVLLAGNLVRGITQLAILQWLDIPHRDINCMLRWNAGLSCFAWFTAIPLGFYSRERIDFVTSLLVSNIENIENRLLTRYLDRYYSKHSVGGLVPLYTREEITKTSGVGHRFIFNS